MTRFQTTLGELNFYEFMKIDYENAYEKDSEHWNKAEIDIELSNKYFNYIDNRIDYGTDNAFQTDRDSKNSRTREESSSIRQADNSAQDTCRIE